MIPQALRNRRWKFPSGRHDVIDLVLTIITTLIEKCVLILGPILICFASIIIAGMSWTFFTIILPMIQRKWSTDGSVDGIIGMGYFVIFCHVMMVVFLLVQICFNYFMCVTTKHDGASYHQVVRELALATNFDYPETPQAIEMFRRDYEDRMVLRMRRRQARAAANNTASSAAANVTTTTTTVTSSTTTATHHQDGAPNSPSSSTTSQPEEQLLQPLLVQSTTSTTTATSSSSNNEKMIIPESADNNNSMVHRKTAATKKNKQHKVTVPPPRLSLHKMRPQQPPQQQQIRNWMLMAPDEWGFCPRSKQPKPPRSHYDHVSKTLVLCLDHYCPWMFNAVGYFNYRYFCNFLWFVELGMMYGACVCYQPFSNTSGYFYKEHVKEFRRTGVWRHIHPMTPINDERLPISLCFMLCLAVGVAVLMLGGFHFYLCISGQTTIEFHANWLNRRRAQQLGQEKYKNPYDLGYQRNWQQVFGSQYPSLLAVLIPSRREPEFLPLPLPGPDGKRRQKQHHGGATYELTKQQNDNDTNNTDNNTGENIV